MLGSIILITHIITGLGDGGAEAVLYRLCKHDRQNSHLVVSLSGRGKYGDMLESIGVSVMTLNMSPRYLALTAFFRLIKLLHETKPDLVQTWMYHADLLGGLAARIARVRALVWGIRHTTLEPKKSARMTIWIARVSAKLSWWVPTKIAVCALRAIEIHESLGYDRSKMTLIPNGYDLRCFKPNLDARGSLRAVLSVQDDRPLIGTVGRFNSQKDHLGLLNALETLRDQGFEFQYVLVGTGVDADNEQLTAWITERGLSDCIHLLGRRNDIPDVMAALDLHVLPSAFGEAFPNVVAEAMACGTPCVVTDVGDAAYIVGDTGWVVPPKDSNALAAAIAAALCALTDPSEFNKRKLCARRRVEENFDIELMVDNYSTLWKQAINDSRV